MVYIVLILIIFWIGKSFLIHYISRNVTKTLHEISVDIIDNYEGHTFKEWITISKRMKEVEDKIVQYHALLNKKTILFYEAINKKVRERMLYTLEKDNNGNTAE
jgi:regulator of PEP synthase PpsR (kinase-PPPase family)